MRDPRFIACHRGGLLPIEQHRQLMTWATACMEHLLPLLATAPDQRLLHAITIAKAWAAGECPTGDAMKASVQAHAAARESTDPVTVAVCRAIGQGVATAHMADHSLGAALYGLKAVQAAGQSVTAERDFQNRLIPPELKSLILEIRPKLEKHFKINF